MILKDKNTEHLWVGYTTGGDSFPYLSVQISEGKASMTALHEGEFPLYDVNARIVDLNKMDKEDITTILGTNISIGSMIPSHASLVPVQLPIEDREVEEQSFNIFMTARNGGFTQLIRLKKINNKWLSATKVLKNNDQVLLEKVDNDFPRNKDIW